MRARTADVGSNFTTAATPFPANNQAVAEEITKDYESFVGSKRERASDLGLAGKNNEKWTRGNHSTFSAA